MCSFRQKLQFWCNTFAWDVICKMFTFISTSVHRAVYISRKACSSLEKKLLKEYTRKARKQKTVQRRNMSEVLSTWLSWLLYRVWYNPAGVLTNNTQHVNMAVVDLLILYHIHAMMTEYGEWEHTPIFPRFIIPIASLVVTQIKSCYIMCGGLK